MKGLKIIPVFIILMVLSYFGVMFVEANREPVILSFGSRATPATPLGFVVLTSVLAGMAIAGLLCSIEIAALFLMNLRLRRRIDGLQAANKATATSAATLSDRIETSTPGTHNA